MHQSHPKARFEQSDAARLGKGFDPVEIEPTRVYGIEEARGFLAAEGLDVDLRAYDLAALLGPAAREAVE